MSDCEFEENGGSLLCFSPQIIKKRKKCECALDFPTVPGENAGKLERYMMNL